MKISILYSGVFAVIFLLFSSTQIIDAQIVVDQTMTPEELVQDHLVGSGLGVANITFNGIAGDQINSQIALCTGTSQFIEFDERIFMATGDAQIAAGGFGGVIIPVTGDPDLYALANTSGSAFSVNDNAILEFDFTPDFPFLSVGYVFASMEYPYYTCSPFNDVFGFFISGPDIDGPFSNNSINIAVIPNTNIPVGINTVNSGIPTSFSPQFCLEANPNFVEDSIYFVDNFPQVAGDIQFPGMTTNLYANFILQEGETYHFKLAVADVSDGALDSGVFLEAASFSAFPLTGQEEFQSFIDGIALNVFPNPTSDYLSFNLATENPTQLDIQLIDFTGKPVLTIANNLSVQKNYLQQVDLNSLSKGVYFLQITDRVSGFTRTEKIQKN